MARPVLLTSAAATGLPGQDGVHFAIADSDEALAERALDLLARPESARAMGENARRLVTERASWPAMLAKLPEIMGHALRLKDRVDAA
jgi:glycosyltransferase involved in cell wall biosynthesis